MDKESSQFSLKNGLDGFTNPLVKLGEALLPSLASLIKGARGDKLKDKKLDLSGLPKAGDYFKDKKSVAEEFADLQDTIDAPSGFVQKSRQPSPVQLDTIKFTMNSRLANRVSQILVKETFQDPMVGQYLKGIGLSIPLARPTQKLGSSNPRTALTEVQDV